jgi:hypothetical protein
MIIARLVRNLWKVGNMGSLITPATPARKYDKSLKILAKSIFRELKENGYDSRHIVSLSTELISLVTSDLKGQETAAGTPQ